MDKLRIYMSIALAAVLSSACIIHPVEGATTKRTYVKPSPVVKAATRTTPTAKPSTVKSPKRSNTIASATTIKSKAPAATPETKKATPKNTKATTPNGSQEPIIRVLLGSRTQAFTISSEEPIAILDKQQKQVQTTSGNGTITIRAEGGYIEVNGKRIDTQISVQNTKGRYGSLLTTLGKTYRGGLTIMGDQSNGMRIINVLGLEQYIQGVVPEEAVPSWPKAALEAQAVAARTYALHTMEGTKHQTYDVSTTTDHQVYGGKSSEYASTNAAVKATHGMVLTYDGKPINALFHSDGGGYTEDSVNVWGNPVSYLKGVADYANHEGTTVWNVVTSRQTLESKLASAGKSVGALQKIELSPLKKRPMVVSDRGVSGRVKTMKFVGSKGTVTVTGEQVQRILGLKSTAFDFYIDQTPPRFIDTGTAKPNHTFGKGNQTVTIHGYGWGHGLGLSQWGAAAMAERKEAAAQGYYQTILKHYYQGATVTKLYQ